MTGETVAVWIGQPSHAELIAHNALGAIGADVEVDYLAVIPGVGTNAAHASGRLGVVLDGDTLAEVAIEGDGSALFIPGRDGREHSTDRREPMTATAAAPAELAPVTVPLADMLRHDADRIASLTLTTGEQLFLTDGTRRLVEVGPDWMLFRTGYGDGEHSSYVRLAAVAIVALR